MLFLFRGRHGPLIRAIAGALLLAAGIVLHNAILIAIGAVLVGWGAAGALSAHRARRYRPTGTTGGTP
jgi:hypothetical protein